MGFFEVKRETVEAITVNKVHRDVLNLEYRAELPPNILLPVKQISRSDGEKVKLYFFPPEGIELKDYRQFNFAEDFESLTRAMENILNLFEATEQRGYKILCFDMKALLFDAELNPYVLCFFPIVSPNDELDVSKFEMPIYVNSKPLKFTDNNSRVVAEIFAHLKYGDEYRSKTPRDRRRFVEDSLLNEGKFDLKNWFEKSMSNKFDTKTCKQRFIDAVNRYKERTLRKNGTKERVRHRTGGHSILGTSKATSEDDFKEEERVNQDAYLIKRISDTRVLIAVMDGVSTARCGDGNLASNIVKNLLAEEAKGLTGELNADTAKSFFESFVRKANESIVNAAKKIDPNTTPDGLMSTTFVSAIVDGYDVYLCSVGDSPALVLSNNEITRINVKHNVAFETLVLDRKISGDPNSLTQVIGKAQKSGDTIEPDNVEFQFIAFKLLPEETLIIGSDGIIDYAFGMYEDEKLESFRRVYEESLAEADGKIKVTAQRLLAKIDKEKARDNLTIVIVKPERKEAM